MTNLGVFPDRAIPLFDGATNRPGVTILTNSAFAILFILSIWGSANPMSDSPEARAVSYLAAEVPTWRTENRCASCHHNGDGAFALFRSIQLGFDVPEDAIANSVAWLEHPDRWDTNGGEGTFSDKRLARIQFARSLAGAVEAGFDGARPALTQAAEFMAADQQADGSWPLDGPDTIGTPTTYGWTLATLSARNVLSESNPDRHRDRINQADDWLRSRPIRTVMDASVELLRRDVSGDPEVIDRRAKSLTLLIRSQAGDGGWGPYETSPPEVFDTALAVLALSNEPGDEAKRAIIRGRSFLIASQSPTGGWQETTRPAGFESDAQHLSTTAWATLALLESRGGDEDEQ